MNNHRWKVLTPAPLEYLEKTGLSPLAIQLLYNRGIADTAQAEAFLNIDEGLQGDPFLLPDIEKAITRIYQALLRGELIAVYGDFDADGLCSTALLTHGLALLGGKTIPYIPHRVKEGYGLNSPSLESLCRQGVTLVITVDCGTSNIPEVEFAKKLGMDIIVTDHHSITDGLPPALAVINPKREGSLYPFSQLAGVGVAFKLLQALFQSLGRKETLQELMDLVALGTIADVVPLIGENRYLVSRGVEAMKKTPRPGLQELMSTARVQSGNINATNISWSLSPRLNAPGRLGHAFKGYRLLVTDSREEALQLAQELESNNNQRRILTEEYFLKAKEQLSISGTDSPLLMTGGADYPPGIIGLIANKLVDEFYRPAIVFEQGINTTKGSARSIADLNIISVLRECQDLLQRFGGHPMAAGLTLPTANLGELQRRLCRIVGDRLSGVELQRFLTIDAEIPLSTIRGETFKLVERFAPFGHGNPVPAFLSRGVNVIDYRPVGSESQHLKIRVKQGNILWEGIGFGLGDCIDELTPQIDIVYNLSTNQWNGDKILELNIIDFAPASPQ